MGTSTTDPALSESAQRNPLLFPAITLGFGVTTMLWVVWFVLHGPWLAMSAGAASPILMATLLLGFAAAGTLVTARRALLVGAAAGAVSGGLNLLVLGMRVVEQPQSTEQMVESANQLRPDAAFIVLGFLAVSILAGAAATALGARIRGRAQTPDNPVWLGRFAVVTVLALAPLIVVGGLVTSAEAGMAVPDSVTSYGAVSFLFPFSLMGEHRIFLEHSHRLFGTLAGLTSIVLLVLVWTGSTARGPKIFSTVLVLAVIGQGILGMIRVGENSPPMAAMHGVLAQIVFAVAVWTAAVCSPAFAAAEDADDRTVQTGKKTKRIALIALHVLLIQLVFGAMTRHLGSSHALWSHIGVAFILTGLVMLMSMGLGKAPADDPIGRTLRSIGSWLMSVVSIQFMLGGFAFMIVGVPEGPTDSPLSTELASADPVGLADVLVTTAHQANGALLVALTILGMAWSGRLSRIAKRRARN